jgi:poly(beta-D-mannuronate) lyase
MKRLLLLMVISFTCLPGMAETILVKDAEDLKKANREAKPGDLIILQNGEWKNITIELDCEGTAAQPITFKAQSAGGVKITGKSKLRLGGRYIVVDGLFFTNGFAGDDAVIDFRIDKKQLANDCRVTNTVISSFNNPKRMDDNYWVEFYGKRNRLDHCTFLDKKNMGVLLAVILDDERSRENFHSIDHNYFGYRLPLASNSGEIIRVGVSQHCEFNSNTQIVDNFFEHCDGETEIVSIKSGSNVVRSNVFKECQGSVVLRHGNFNTVENNIFLGNNKPGTGGVRVINKGQWVVNNLFYQCRGVGFRAPLSIMNGVPNSPAFRYVAVTDAVIMNNSFVNCTPISLCEGSDTERSVIPTKVLFEKNIFYNTRDEKIYNAYDDISGISFRANSVSNQVPQNLAKGFYKVQVSTLAAQPATIPVIAVNMPIKISDSLKEAAALRLFKSLPLTAGFTNKKLLQSVTSNAYKNCGAPAAMFKNQKTKTAGISKSCSNAAEVVAALKKNNFEETEILLTGNEYIFSKPLEVNTKLLLKTNVKGTVKFLLDNKEPFLLEVKAGGALTLTGLNLDLQGNRADYFISTDVSGSSGHSNINIKNCSFSNNEGAFFNASKYSVLDSMIVTSNQFNNNQGQLFNFFNEDDKKGYYNVEKLTISNNVFDRQQAPIISMLRGGNDESTLGPLLQFNNNTITGSDSKEKPLILLNGTQLSFITNNRFSNSNTGNVSIQFVDAVRAVHTYQNNSFRNSGKVLTNKFTEEKNNSIQ